MQILLNHLLFINYAVPLNKLRVHVPAEFDLDTRVDHNETEMAFVSAVAFNVAEIRSNALPIPNVSFNQINYRAYIRTPDRSGVYFLDLRVGSRMIAASASFLRLPVTYESIELTFQPSTVGLQGGSQRYVVESGGEEGLIARVVISHPDDTSDQPPLIASEFITERPLGFLRTVGGGIHRAAVEHEKLEAVRAEAESVRCRRLETLGVLDSHQSERPHSIFYVSHALFDAKLL